MKKQSYPKNGQYSQRSTFRKNDASSDFIIKEETKFCKQLLDMQKDLLSSGDYYKKGRIVGSQAARICGLAKVHGKDVPTRPLLSMPGSQYESLSIALSDILTKLPETNIKTDGEDVLKTIQTSTNMKLFWVVISKACHQSVPLWKYKLQLVCCIRLVMHQLLLATVVSRCLSEWSQKM